MTMKRTPHHKPTQDPYYRYKQLADDMSDVFVTLVALVWVLFVVKNLFIG